MLHRLGRHLLNSMQSYRLGFLIRNQGHCRCHHPHQRLVLGDNVMVLLVVVVCCCLLLLKNILSNLFGGGFHAFLHSGEEMR
jgi:hypothetical protein